MRRYDLELALVNGAGILMVKQPCQDPCPYLKIGFAPLSPITMDDARRVIRKMSFVESHAYQDRTDGPGVWVCALSEFRYRGVT